MRIGPINMRILIVNPVFPPEPVVSSITSAQLARFLSDQGHVVSVVTGFPCKPRGRLYPGYKLRLFRYEKAPEGYRLVRCFRFISSKSTMWSRFLENISFGLTSGWFVLTARRQDALYLNTWPIFSAGILALVARVRRLEFVLNIQDIYPESLVAQRRITQNGVIARGLRSVDRWIAKISSTVVVPAPSFARVYRQSRGLPIKKLHFVPNWFDKKCVVANDIQGVVFRKKLRIPLDAPMVLYGGNVGEAAGVETVIESFRYLNDIETLYLAIAGDGTNLRACQMMAADMEHPRIRFYTPWPIAETSSALSAADILVLPTRGRQSLVSIPSKLIVYMLAARPVLALSYPESDLAQIVNESGCGWVVPPDRPRELAAKLRPIVGQSKNILRSRGLAGYKYALSNFTGEVCLPKIAAIIGEAASGRTGSGALDDAKSNTDESISLNSLCSE